MSSRSATVSRSPRISRTTGLTHLKRLLSKQMASCTPSGMMKAKSRIGCPATSGPRMMKARYRYLATSGLVENKKEVNYHLVLTDVHFKVSEAGRQRVIRDKRKNVHAFAVGIISTTPLGGLTGLVCVGYNPYKAGHFIRKDTGEAIAGCKHLLLTVKQCDGKNIPVVLAKFSEDE